MIQINDQTPTVRDVIQISGKAATLSVLDYLKELKDAWIERYGATAIFNEFRFTCLLSDAFTAGYMQGKREQRAEQAQRKAREHELIMTSKLHSHRDMAKHYIDLVDSEAGAKAMNDVCFMIWRQWKYKGAWQDGEGANT